MSKEYTYIDSKFDNVFAYYWENGERKSDLYKIPKTFYVKKVDYPNINLANFSTFKGEYTSIYGDKVKRIKALRSYKDIELKDKFKSVTSFELDFRADERFFSEYPIKMSRNPRIIYFDIETLRDENGRYSSPEKATGVIIMISLYDNLTEKYMVLVRDPNGEKKTIEKENTKIIYFENEKNMLNYFYYYMRFKNPDYISGWNTDGYDIPYIINRSNVLGITINFNERREYYKNKKGEIKISGIGNFDLYLASKRLKISEDEGYKLNVVAKKILGEEKIDVDDIDEAYKNNLEKLIEYNIKDVKLCVDIEKRVQICEIFTNFYHYSPMNLNTPLTITKSINYILKRMYPELALANIDNKGEWSTYEGGFVFPSEEGIFYQVFFIDAVSMYPSQIRAFNISPETIRTEETPNTIKVKEGIYFNQEHRGYIPKMIDQIFEERISAKKNKEAAKSTALKLIMNSTYGALGFNSSRIKHKYCAEAITFLSRNLIKTNAKGLEKEGYKVIAGDTDSVATFVPRDKDFESERNKIEQISNEKWCKEFANNFKVNPKYFGMEIDKIFDKFILYGVKKKYVGRTPEGKIKITGLEIKKKDTPKITKEFMMDLTKELITNDDVSFKDLKNIYEKYIDKLKTAIKNRDFKYFSIPAELGKEMDEYKGNTIHVRAARVNNLSLGTGESFFWFYTSSNDVYAFKSLGEIKENVTPAYSQMKDRCLDMKFGDFYQRLFFEQRKLF